MYPSNVMNKLVYVDFYIMCHRELCTCVDNILGVTFQNRRERDRCSDCAIFKL